MSRPTRPRTGRRSAAACTAALLVATLLSSCSSLEDVEPETRSFDPGDDRVALTLDSGELSIAPGDVDAVEITRWFSGDAEDGRWELVDGVVELGVDCGLLHPCDVRYEVVVPDDLPVSVSAESATISAHGFETPVELRTENGDLRVEQSSGPLTLRSTSGAQRGTALSSPELETSSENGKVDLAFDTAPGAVSVTTDNGAADLVLPDETYAVSISTDNGEVENALDEDDDSPRRVTISTDNGSVSLRAG